MQLLPARWTAQKSADIFFYDPPSINQSTTLLTNHLLDVAEVDVVDPVLDLVYHVEHAAGRGDETTVQAQHETVRAQRVNDHRVVGLHTQTNKILGGQINQCTVHFLWQLINHKVSEYRTGIFIYLQI
jgi:hypothetical protein